MIGDTKIKQGRRWQIAILGLFAAILAFGSVDVLSQSANADIYKASNFVPLGWFAYSPDVNDIYEQKINVNVTDATLDELFMDINNQANVRLSYDGQRLPDNRVTLFYQDISLVDLFEIISTEHNLETYASASGQLIITPKLPKSATEAALQETFTVTGRVTSLENQEALPGVNIRIAGTSRGAITDIDGEYELLVDAQNDTLIFSYVGYSTVVEPINGRSEIDVVLELSSIIGGELVVIGYGDTQRRDLTGSVSSVSSTDITRSTSGTFDRSLRGQAAGVMVMGNTGQPGGGTSVRIRGTNTLTGGAEPLYVIDGVPVSGESGNSTNPLATLNPSDIASVDILKDASAAAIYGARAANGVILVTTKRGQAGELLVDYNGSVGMQQLPTTVETMTLQDYAMFRNRQAEQLGQGFRQEFQDPSILGEGTNWQNELFRTAPMHEHNLAFSGGTEDTRYRLSLGYFDQEGIAIGSRFDRYSVRLNLDNSPNNWLDIGTSINLSRTNERLTVTDSDLINIALQQTPDVPVRMPDGSFGGPAQSEFTLVNPVGLAQLQENTLERAEVQGNIFAVTHINSNLNIRSEFSGMYSVGNQSNFNPRYTFGELVNDENSGSQNKNVVRYNQGRLYANYDNRFFDDRLRTNIVGGYEIEETEFEWVYGERINFTRDNVRGLSAGSPEDMVANGSSGSNALESMYTRVNFDLDSRYLLTATMRRDKSSRFGIENRAGYFPSFSAAWRISSEPFFDVSFVDDLKIRAGYGFVGNQDIGNNRFVSTLIVTATRWGSGLRPSNYANPFLQWESTESMNVGLDFVILEDRINLTADAYIQTTKDLLLQQPLPLYAGTSGTGSIEAPTVNIGSLENKGIELTLNTINLQRELTWESRFIYTMNRNQVTAMDQETSFIERNINFFDPVSRTMVGHPVGTFYGYVVEGVFEDADDIRNHASQHDNINPNNGVWPGDLKFKDISGDGMIDENDRTVIGDPNPDFQFGVTNDFYFRNFDASIFINGSYGNDIFNEVRRTNENPSRHLGLLATVNDHARLELRDPDGDPNDVDNVFVQNPETTVPRITASDPNSNQRISDRFVEDGSYIRIQNITIGYSLPQSVLNRINIRSMRVYASVDNLYTFTRYSGFDPDVGSQMNNPDPLLIGVDTGRYPSQRLFLFGLSLSL